MDADNFEDVLVEFGKTLSRIQLYSLQHPLVQEAVGASYEKMSRSLMDHPELTLAWTENKLLVNGAPVAGLAGVQDSLGGFFKKFQIHSLTFRQGVSQSEMISFYKLLSGQQEALRSAEGVRSFLESQNVRNVEVNVEFFSKVSEKDLAAIAAGGGGEGTVSEKASKIIRNIESAPIDQMLWEVIGNIVESPTDQQKIYEIIAKQIQGELAGHVDRATRQLRQEKEQITSEKERTESVINNIAEGIVVVDEEGRVVMMNPTAEAIYGSTLSQMKGRVLLEHKRDEVMITLSKDTTAAPRKESAARVSIQSAADTQEVIRNSTATIKTPDGKIVGIMSILNDISKMRELQRMQEDFIANVTHELRSPLTAIKAALGTMEDSETPLSPPQKQILSLANRNIERLARLINDILDFGKVSSGKVALALKPVDPKPLLQDTVQSLRSWAESKQIAFSLQIPERLPRILVDSDRLIQVLVNLISNAVKFTPRGGSVTLSGEPSLTFLKILVKDTGPGIPKKDQPRLFEKFFQLKQTEKSDTPGTGLGLYITKAIVEMHGGQIGFTSEEGQGSTFYFTMPIVPESAPAPSFLPPTPAVPKPEKKKGWLARLFGK